MELLPGLNIEYPILNGRSVLIIDSPVAAAALFDHLKYKQHMEADFLDEIRFPSDLNTCLNFRGIEACILHVPGVESQQGIEFYTGTVYAAYKEHPKMIILEGYPSHQNTIDMYEQFRQSGIPMLDKFPFTHVVAKLAELFTPTTPDPLDTL